MRSLGFLAIGLALGFLMGFYWNSSPKEAVIIQTELKETKTQQTKIDGLTSLPKKTSATSSKPSITKKTSLVGRQMTVSNQIIEQLERDWNDLPQQVRLVREEEGWRVTNLQKASSFARLGFVEGDLITKEAFDALNRMGPIDQDLARRFSRILNRVTY